jgi:formate-dependent nitrite reductase cytochrome c552 subunit
MESVHYKASDERFNCWMCHNPHGYELALREDKPIVEVVKISNDMCLSCHDNKFKYGLLSDDEPRNLAEVHSWLPKQGRHFAKVRCVDCHTKVQEDILVAHNVLPKEEALRNCVQCHSSNSVLMESLYAHRAKESRQESGFFNAVVLNEGYIIGANRNKALNYISLGIFGLLIIGIGVHAVLRLILLKKK